MIEKGKIAVHQFTVLTILFTVGSSILIAPSGLAREAGEDAWIAAAAALLGGLLLVLLYNQLAGRYPGTTFVRYSQDIIGKWPGRIVCLLYACFFFVLAALVLRNIGDFVTTQILNNTPIHFIHALYLLAIIAGIRNGVETFTRTAEMFMPWVMFFFVVMVVLLPTQFETGHLLPVLGHGVKPVLRAAIPVLGTPYMELVTLLVLLPFVSQARKAKKAFLAGVSIGGLMLLAVVLLSILVLGDNLTARHMYPSYSLAKKITIGTFLERLEVVMAGIWFITIYFKLAVCFYAATITLAELFKLKEAKPLYLPLGMLMAVLSIVAYPDVTYFMNFAMSVYVGYALPFALGFPLLLLIVAVLRNKREAA